MTAFEEASYPVVGALKWERSYFAMQATPLTPVAILWGHLLYITARLVMVSVVFVAVMVPFGVFATWWSPIAAIGASTLIGLTFTLGMIYSTGSGNWPALLLIDWIALLVLSYALRNPLLLTLTAVVFFCWFGGFTGYASGWGAYWFGMGYPLRFLAAAATIVAVAVIHQQSEKGPLAPFRGFFKIWLSSGLFFAEMALWLLSLFGNFNLENQGWHWAGGGELVLFNSLWAILNVALIGAGARLMMRMLTGYGATFLIIQIYTLFFAHLSEDLGLPLSLLIAGGGALALTFYLERRRRINA